MDWSDVGKWLKDNAAGGAMLVGSLLAGNVPGAIAAGAALVSSATGTTDPAAALKSLQADPATMVKLKELAAQEEAHIRDNLRLMEEARLKDAQLAHSEQQQTIRAGDTTEDEYVRHTRPLMARQSWYGMALYIVLAELGEKAGWINDGASFELAALIGSPALAYIGFRSMFDKGGVLGMFGRLPAK